MHIESLESRKLMSATGTDGSFGDHGVLALPDAVGTARVATADAIFIAVDAYDLGARLSKYTLKGKLDTTWGDDGTAAVTTRVQTMAFDARTGGLFVAGTVANSTTLSVQHVDAGGDVDDGFGDDGIARPYSVSPVADANVFVTTERLAVLDDGALLIGFSGNVRANADYNVPGRIAGDEKLLRLRADGSIDRAFARRGVLALLSGEGTRTSEEHGSGIDGSRVRLDDLVVEDDGTYRVVLTRSTGAGYIDDDTPDRSAPLAGKVEVKARTITATGANVEAQAHSWTLRADDEDAPETLVLLAQYDGRDHVAVVSTRNGDAFWNRLTPGKKASPRPISTGDYSGFVSAARNPDGNVFLASADRVVRVLDSLRIDPRFGDRGRGSFDPGYYNVTELLPDDRNGVFAAYYDVDLGMVQVRFA